MLTFDLATLATTYRLPDEALPEFHRWARDKKPSEILGPACWEVVYIRPTGWAVMDGERTVLGREGGWAYSPQPSSRTDDFKRLYRWPSAEVAMQAACIAAGLYPNGYPSHNCPEPWNLWEGWEVLWARYQEETARAVRAFAEGQGLL